MRFQDYVGDDNVSVNDGDIQYAAIVGDDVFVILGDDVDENYYYY